MTDLLAFAGLHVPPADRARVLDELRRGALRAWELHRVVDDHGLRWPMLRSTTLAVGQYWADEGEDAVHEGWLHSQLEVPRADVAWDTVEDPDPVNLPDLDADRVAALRDDQWRLRGTWPDNDLAIPLFGAWGVDGADQEQLAHEAHRPVVTWRRHDGGATLSWHPPARPHLDGAAPLYWAEGGRSVPAVRAEVDQLRALGRGAACLLGDDLDGPRHDRLVRDAGVDPTDAFALDRLLWRARRGALVAWGIREQAVARAARLRPGGVVRLTATSHPDGIALRLDDVDAPARPTRWEALRAATLGRLGADRAPTAPAPAAFDREAGRLAWPLFAAWVRPGETPGGSAVVATWRRNHADGVDEVVEPRLRPWADGVDPAPLRGRPEAAWTHAAYTLAELAHLGGHGDLVLPGDR